MELVRLGFAGLCALLSWRAFDSTLAFGVHDNTPCVALATIVLVVCAMCIFLMLPLARQPARPTSGPQEARLPCQCRPTALASHLRATVRIGCTNNLDSDNASIRYPPVPPSPPSPVHPLGLAVHSFGADPFVDTVLRGALTLCDPIAAQIDASTWRRFKGALISRYGGPLSFALACEVHPDTLDQERWAKVDDGDDERRVVVGRTTIDKTAGIVAYGQLVVHAGVLKPHGYAIRQHQSGLVYEGRWNHGLWIEGYIYRSPTHQCDSTIQRVFPFSPDKISFTVNWRTWDTEGRPRSHVRHPSLPTARRTSMSRATWPSANYPVYCNGWTPPGACAVCICRFRNGDQYAEARDGDKPPIILYYYIDAVPRGKMVTNCTWTILPADPTAAYTGVVFYPTDARSYQFQTMADYVLSDRSSEAFSPAQHNAFVAAIRAAQAS